MGIKFHRNPAERRWFEKILRRFILNPNPPRALVWGGWKKRDTRLARTFPIRWFVWETVPDLWNYKIRKTWRGIKDWFRFRIQDKFHIVKLELEPRYYDPEIRLLHANFQILKDFVEIELAAWLDPSETSKSEPWSRFRKHFRRNRRRNIRNPAAGIEHLDWEITETMGSQQTSAIEKKEIYDWWVNIRPLRDEPLSSKVIWGEERDNNDLTSPAAKARFTLADNLAKFYDDEDEAMLCRLIKIRRSLWT